MDKVSMRKVHNRSSKDVRKISAHIFVILCFSTSFFVTFLYSNTLFIIAMFLTGLLIAVFNKSYNPKLQIDLSLLWVVAYFVVIMSYFRTQINVNDYVDFFVFFLGITFLLNSGSTSGIFKSSRKIILIFSIFYAFSIWIQIYLSSFYQIYLRELPGDVQKSILDFARSSAYAGFSHNPGITAFYICCGVLLIYSLKGRASIVRKNIIMAALIMFLIISVLLTGKRAPLFFLIISLVGMYIFARQGIKRIRSIIRIVSIFILLIVFFVILEDLLMEIPIISYYVESVYRLLGGEDIGGGSVKRVDLFAYAWDIFKDNSIFGIGWSNFRHRAAGTLTYVASIEAHNMYLQILAETGIIGFITIMGSIVAFIVATFKSVSNYCNNREKHGTWRDLLMFSMGYQIFFLLNGLTDSVIYSPHWLLMYFYSCGIVMAYRRSEESVQVRRKILYDKENTIAKGIYDY